MKKCSICKNEKPFVEFNKNKSKADGLQSHCRECSKTKFKLYWQSNKAKQLSVVKERNNVVKKVVKKFCYDFLANAGCIDCGENDPIVLEFDHVRGTKHLAVSEMVKRGYSLSSLKEEIGKCEVRCANCHRKKTAKDFGWYSDII